MQQWNQIRLPVPWTAPPAAWLPLSRCTKEFRCPRGMIKASFTRHCAAYSLQITATTAVLFRLECASEDSGHLSDEAGPRFDGFCLSQPKTDKVWLMAASTYYQRTSVSIKVEIDCSWAAIRNFKRNPISRGFTWRNFMLVKLVLWKCRIDHLTIRKLFIGIWNLFDIIDIFRPADEKDLAKI